MNNSIACMINNRGVNVSLVPQGLSYPTNSSGYSGINASAILALTRLKQNGSVCHNLCGINSFHSLLPIAPTMASASLVANPFAVASLTKQEQPIMNNIILPQTCRNSDNTMKQAPKIENSSKTSDTNIKIKQEKGDEDVSKSVKSQKQVCVAMSASVNNNNLNKQNMSTILLSNVKMYMEHLEKQRKAVIYFLTKLFNTKMFRFQKIVMETSNQLRNDLSEIDRNDLINKALLQLMSERDNMIQKVNITYSNYFGAIIAMTKVSQNEINKIRLQSITSMPSMMPMRSMRSMRPIQSFKPFESRNKKLIEKSRIIKCETRIVQSRSQTRETVKSNNSKNKKLKKEICGVSLPKQEKIRSLEWETINPALCYGYQKDGKNKHTNDNDNENENENESGNDSDHDILSNCTNGSIMSVSTKSSLGCCDNEKSDMSIETKSHGFAFTTIEISTKKDENSIQKNGNTKKKTLVSKNGNNKGKGKGNENVKNKLNGIESSQENDSGSSNEWNEIDCDASLKANSLKMNDDFVLTNDNFWKCKLCDKILKTKGGKMSHIKIHLGIKDFECKYCGRRFSNHTTCVRHERVHTGEKPFSCEVCAKKFRQKHALTIHKRIHTNDEMFVCQLCDKKYTQSSSLARHKLLNHEMAF